jgi:diguanylate cyclase (GGDEF)-like protein
MMSVLLLDVDYFKRINDNYGHTGGDRVLMDIALRAETVIRNIDYFARIGGEEFGVLLLQTDQTSALNVGERLRSALDRPKYASASTIGIGQIAAYSVSVGVATLRDGKTFAELIRRADAALYKAKSSGRNTVVCASSGLLRN